MNPTKSAQLSASASSPWPVILLGLLALAMAMGVGRFAFTPMMPLMMRDGSLDAATGTEWAAVNYLGYLLGALSASWFARQLKLGLHIGLIGVALSTLGMMAADLSQPWVGGSLRLVAGVFSAWVMICASSWCLPELVRRGAGARAGLMYTGVGGGIAFTGLMTWLGGTQSAYWLWLELGVLASLGGAYALYLFWREAKRQAASVAQAPAPAASAAGNSGGNGAVVLCYAAFGFGYIVPATFLPTMARELVDNPLVFGLTWPVFGAAAALSVVLVSRLLGGWSRQRVWALGQSIMAFGTLLPLLQQSLLTLTGAALLVGGTFMITTMAGLQLARERMPANPTVLLARMTAGFAAGQIAGPLLVRLIGQHQLLGLDALGWAHLLATLLLALSAAWLWWGGKPAATARADKTES